MSLLEFTDKGIFCPQGGFYIDPWKPVSYAIVTHAHSDHARWGMKHYLAHSQSAEVLRLRLGADISLQTAEYGDEFNFKGVKISLHPAGHCIGSAQVRVEHKGEVWVVSGDYKLENDGISAAFQPVRCHTFITESTFGLPVFDWEPQAVVIGQIDDWWSRNQNEGKASLLIGYSLGKAQRILQNVNKDIGPIVVHGAIASTNTALQNNGIVLPDFEFASTISDKSLLSKALVLAPPSAASGPWIRRFGSHATGMCSGWMALRGNKRRNALDRGFVLSDHADWKGLLTAVSETGAQKIYATHGYSAAFSRHLQEQGLDAFEIETLFGSGEDEVEDHSSEEIQSIQ